MIPIEGLLDKYEVDYDPGKSGNQQIICPFHDEKHPSASVNLGEGVLNCFACDAQGDAIALLMRYEGMEFSDAKRVAQELADKSGAPVSRRSDRGGSYLPRRQGSRPGRREWKSPWTRKRP